MAKASKPSKPYSEIAKPDWMSDAEWKEVTEQMTTVDQVKRDAKAHLEAYLATNGEMGYDGRGGKKINFSNLILTTIGRKSGQPRSTPLNFHQDGENYYLVGSLAGFETDPQWALNLKANPQAWLQVRDKKWEVVAQELKGEERKRMWPILCKTMPVWGLAQQRTDREFSLFLLTPKK